MKRIGSRKEVMNKMAKQTAGGLKMKDLKYNKFGKIVSKKLSNKAKRENRLQKAGYYNIKGQFGSFKMNGGTNNDSKIEVSGINGNPEQKKEKLPKDMDELGLIVLFYFSKKKRDEITNKYGHIEDWDVSDVTDMSMMFKDAPLTNEDFSNWNVSNVTRMDYMFWGCKTFVGSGLDGWNVSKVTDMNYMFDGCLVFNANLSKWDVSNVVDMRSMFNMCKNFTGDGLENWKINRKVIEKFDLNEIFFGSRVNRSVNKEWKIKYFNNKKRFVNTTYVKTNIKKNK